MNLIETSLAGVYLIEPTVHGDARGWFFEVYSRARLLEAGLEIDFVQDNHSYSAQAGTLRGLHFQNDPYAQTKLVRCTRGRIRDVAVDIRRGSPQFGRWVAVELSEENKRQLFVPRGFAHGFVTLCADVEVQYKVDAYYHAASDRSIRYDDSALGVDWGAAAPILSAKDQQAPLLAASDCTFTY
jgi:dTDP-4-dehydrorhamnose 3,5-epimerase